VLVERRRPERPEELRGQVGTCRCGAWWTGYKTTHCAAEGCHQTFTGVTAFDKHWTPQHRHPSGAGLVLVDRAYRQKVWGFPPMTEEQREKAFGGRAT